MPRFGDKPERQQSEAARALGVHPSSINRLVNEGKGGSVQMIERVEKLLNEPKGTILGYASGEPRVPRFRDLANFAAVLDEATKRAVEGKVQITRLELERAGDFAISPPSLRLTPDLLIQLALAASDIEPPPKLPKGSRKK